MLACVLIGVVRLGSAAVLELVELVKVSEDAVTPSIVAESEVVLELAEVLEDAVTPSTVADAVVVLELVEVS